MIKLKFKPKYAKGFPKIRTNVWMQIWDKLKSTDYNIKSDFE